MKNKYILRRIIALLVIVGIVWALGELTTPKRCDVPLSKMSQGCKDFLYP